MLKSEDMKRLMSADIDLHTAKALSVAVVDRALQDYKDNPSERAGIEKWIRSGDIWLDILFPDLNEEAIIEGFRKYAEKVDE